MELFIIGVLLIVASLIYCDFNRHSPISKIALSVTICFLLFALVCGLLMMVFNPMFN